MPEPRKVLTPGSYTSSQKRASNKTPRQQGGSNTTPRSSKVTVRGRPTRKRQNRPGRQIGKYRSTYSQEDLDEAVRLVQESGYCIKRAALKMQVPRMTLSDRLNTKSPRKRVQLGRRPELSKEVELAIVKCLKVCAEYLYPMRKRDLQQLIQAYCTENNVITRWPENLPGKHFIRNFQNRWKTEVKLRKPSNIKRSRAQVTINLMCDFF